MLTYRSFDHLLDLKSCILILDFVSIVADVAAVVPVVAVAERVGSCHVILISDWIGQMAQ